MALPDRRVIEMQSRLCRVLASPRRLEILYVLQHRGEVAAGELAEAIDTSTANLSQHLSLMREQGLVAARKDGQNMYYSIALPGIMDACQAVHQVLISHLEVVQDTLKEHEMQNWPLEPEKSSTP